MPEPTTAASMTLAASAVAVPVLTFLGVPLGLRVDEILAGFAGAVAAMALLNSVPSTGDSLRELLRTSFKRASVALSSGLAAGYLTPLANHVFSFPLSLDLAAAFLIGAAAQRSLRFFVNKFFPKPAEGGA